MPLSHGEQLRAYEGVKGTQLVSLDETQHHGSLKIHCQDCRVTVRKDKAYYEHQVIMAVLCAPEQAQGDVPGTGVYHPSKMATTRDCEQAAIKRWVRRHASNSRPGG